MLWDVAVVRILYTLLWTAAGTKSSAVLVGLVLVTQCTQLAVYVNSVCLMYLKLVGQNHV